MRFRTDKAVAFGLTMKMGFNGGGAFLVQVAHFTYSLKRGKS